MFANLFVGSSSCIHWMFGLATSPVPQTRVTMLTLVTRGPYLAPSLDGSRREIRIRAQTASHPSSFQGCPYSPVRLAPTATTPSTGMTTYPMIQNAPCPAVLYPTRPMAGPGTGPAFTYSVLLYISTGTATAIADSAINASCPVNSLAGHGLILHLAHRSALETSTSSPWSVNHRIERRDAAVAI